MSAAISAFRQSFCNPRSMQNLLPRKRFMCNYLKMKSVLEDGPPLTLLGPPELYQPVEEQPKPSEEQPKPETLSEEQNCTNPFVNEMVSNFNRLGNVSFSKYGAAPRASMGFTENGSPTFLSSGNPCLDFFFQVVPDTPPHRVRALLEKAWQKDPLTSLKLVMNLLGVRGTGKSDREGFYTSALWLYQNHPKTLAYNDAAICEFGYYKNVLEILYRLVKGEDVREKEKKDYGVKLQKKGEMKNWYHYGVKQKISREEQMKIGLEKYHSDEAYRFLHNAVSYVFSEALKKDLENMKSGNFFDITYAAKWCPSVDRSYDKALLLCESIGRRMFPKDLPEYEDVEDAHYAYRVRDRLNKEVLVPLRKIQKVPEGFMGAGKWSEVDYSRVPSVAMKNYTEVFLKHDNERFSDFLEKVKKGEKKIAAGALLPHQLIESVMNSWHYDDDGDDDDDDDDCEDDDSKVEEVADLQWKRMVEDLSKIGKLNNCMAISDVSGSMYGLPLYVSIALGMLVSELSEEPWKGKLITFSEKPELHLVQGESLKEKASFVHHMNWDMNTNFQKVFDTILEVAKAGNLSQDQMIKRLFVFSDMEFDKASLNPWETDYEAICRKFKEAGYETVPEIVFWNLRDSCSTPVTSDQKGVALVSGFSKNMMKVFMNTGEVLSPEDVMMEAISGKEYQQLVVVD